MLFYYRASFAVIILKEVQYLSGWSKSIVLFKKSFISLLSLVIL